MAVVVYKFSRSGGARVKSERMEEERIVGEQVEKNKPGCPDDWRPNSRLHQGSV